MTTSSLDPRAAEAARRLRLRFAVVLFALAAVAAGVLAGSGSARDQAGPQRGGNLKILGSSDIFNLDTTSAYYTVSNILERSYTRQLLGYRNTPNFLDQIKLTPDLATAVPSTSNGGMASSGTRVRPDR
jgi:peptide/nickel transport system substrate-binding protein